MRARISNREWILSELFPLPAELSAAAAPPPRMCAVVYHLWPLKVSQIIIITYAREAAAQDSLLCGSILWNFRKLCENSADFIDFSFFNRPDQNTVPSIPSSPSLRMGIWGLLKTFWRRSFRVLIKIIILFLVSVLCGDCVLCVIYQVRARSPVNQCQSASQWAPWSPLSRLCPPLLHSISCWLWLGEHRVCVLPLMTSWDIHKTCDWQHTRSGLDWTGCHVLSCTWPWYWRDLAIQSATLLAYPPGVPTDSVQKEVVVVVVGCWGWPIKQLFLRQISVISESQSQ